MKTLAKGTSSECVFKLLKVLLDTQQGDFEEAIKGDTTVLHDIADELNVSKPVFSAEEAQTFNKKSEVMQADNVTEGLEFLR